MLLTEAILNPSEQLLQYRTSLSPPAVEAHAPDGLRNPCPLPLTGLQSCPLVARSQMDTAVETFKKNT